ncbi:thiamine pyrophosphate-binding protein [Egibacter rhizosphaerae]|uniref:Thiamine pyrophosphate-binding protein n=1 Tax=Egibacter rhizosphaerae TaxID=1670831 RepID=A0A411YJR8_9ACTN|nr:thiamine pyrophosphate-binding protein [Egibacter rhizosphaerae]QBI21437.1 thiamine pyrophosphate-binding protein [Egibacter rhizosphaerae]
MDASTPDSAAIPAARSGGRVVVDQLLRQGVDRVFSVPGESFLPVLDGLYDVADRISLVVCRHEGSAANMADAHGKLTGRPGVCLVTRGPGATHASVGLHTAHQDSTPLVALVGLIPRGHREREAFQEIDLPGALGWTTKWVAEVDEAARLPELLARAFHVASSGRPGPVALGLPEDVLTEFVVVDDAPPARSTTTHPAPESVDETAESLERARRPLLLVGGGGWTPQASDELAGLAADTDLPVVAAFRRQDVLDNDDPRYVGVAGLGIDPALAQRLHDADLVVAIGPRLGDATTGGYTHLLVPRPRQQLVHVHPDPDELGRVYQPHLAIASNPEPFLAALRARRRISAPPWAAWRADARADYERFQEGNPEHGDVVLSAVMATLRDRLPRDAIVTNGAGNYTVWVHRYLRWHVYRTQLAPTSGAMGYGVPAAIAAKLHDPERVVVAFAGDGCFLMSAGEFATAVQYGLGVVFIVVNNRRYATIRMHQERQFPGRPFGTDVGPVDFAALARAHGAHGERVTHTDEFAPAFDRARSAGGPVLLDVVVEPDQLLPHATVTSIRAVERGGA